MKTNFGFTLIEFMLVATVMAVLLALGLPNLTSYVVSSKSNGAADLISQDLHFSKYYALRNRNKTLFITVKTNAMCLSTTALPNNTCDVRRDVVPSPTELKMTDALDNTAVVTEISFDSIYGLPSRSVTFIATTPGTSTSKVKKVTLNAIGLISTQSL